jgi:hypothetical protein
MAPIDFDAFVAATEPQERVFVISQDRFALSSQPDEFKHFAAGRSLGDQIAHEDQPIRVANTDFFEQRHKLEVTAVDVPYNDRSFHDDSDYYRKIVTEI